MNSPDSPPPTLLIVLKAIPSDIQALSHAFERINELLLPTTIDSAVYNELDRVIRVYEPFRRWTVGAMDGAAARGRLDLLKKLRVGRSAGCSSKAFIGAARNNQLEVLQWLHRYYGDQSKPAKELKAAAERSHMQVIEYLRPSMRERQVGPALEAAAANGDMEVIQALLPGPILMDRVFIAAASNGHAPVVQFLLPQHNDVYAGIVLTSAAGFGHIAVMQVAIDRCSTTHIKRAVNAAAGRGQIEVVRMLLRRVDMDATAFANAMLAAASGEHCDVLSLLLQHWSRFEATAESDGTEAGDKKLQKQYRAVRDEISLMFTRAVEKGHTSVVKVLAPKVSFPVGGLVRMTASTSRVEIMEVLLEIAQGRDWKKDRLRASLTDALPRAAATGCVAMARLLVDKCGDIDTGLAFKVAVSRKYIDCVKIFAEKSSRGFKVGALVKLARKGRLEVLSVLLELCSQKTILDALLKIATAENEETSKLVLEKCDHSAYTQIFGHAAEHGFVVLVQQLLDGVDSCTVNRALTRAAARGHADVVQNLMDRCDETSINFALEAAALEGRANVVEMLRGRCEPGSVKNALAKATAVGYDEVVHLLSNKKARIA